MHNIHFEVKILFNVQLDVNSSFFAGTSTSQLNNQAVLQNAHLWTARRYTWFYVVFFFLEIYQILAPTTGSPTQETVLYRVLYIPFLAFPLIKMYAQWWTMEAVTTSGGGLSVLSSD